MARVESRGFHCLGSSASGLHHHGYRLAHAVLGLVDTENHSFELVVLSTLVIAHTDRAVFIGHVAGGRRDNPMLADPGACDVGAVGEALFIGRLGRSFAED
jgi:hypothetical protein